MGGEVNPQTQALLDALAPKWGHLRIRSAWRSPEENKRVGGASQSQHLHGGALDIDISGLSEAEKAQFAQDAWAAGARGFGIYPSGNSLHVDTRAKTTFWGPQGYNSSPAETFPAWAQPLVRQAAQPVPQPTLPSVPSKGPSAVAKAPTPMPKTVDTPDPFEAELDKHFGFGKKAADDFSMDSADMDQFLKKSPNAPKMLRPGYAERMGQIAKFPKFYGLHWAPDGSGWDENGEMVRPPGHFEKMGGKAKISDAAAGIPYDKTQAFANGVAQGWGPELTQKFAEQRGIPQAEMTAEAVRAAREREMKASPTGTLVSEIGGSVAGSLPIMGAGGEALAAAAPHLGRAGQVINRLAAPQTYAQGAARGAVEGAAGGALGSHLNPDVGVGTQAGIGAGIGAAFGPLGVAASRYFTARGVPARSVANQAETLQGNGVRMYGDQLMTKGIAGSPEQIAQYTNRWARHLGIEDILENHGGVTQPAINEVRQRLGRQFETTLTGMGDIPVDAAFLRSIGQLYQQAQANPNMQQAEMRGLTNVMTKIAQGIRRDPQAGIVMDPHVFHDLVKYKGSLWQLRGNQNTRESATGVYNGMMDWLGRVAPQGRRDFELVRQRYRDWSKLEGAMDDAARSGAGGGGMLDPAKVARKASSVSDEMKDFASAGGMIPRAGASPEAGGMTAGQLAKGVGLPTAAAIGLTQVPWATVANVMASPMNALAAGGAAVLAGGVKGLRDRYRNSGTYVRNLIENAREGLPPEGPAFSVVPQTGRALYGESRSDENKLMGR